MIQKKLQVKPKYVYVASSWRNDTQPGFVEMLRHYGIDTYDFRNPPHGQGGFHWSDIDPQWKSWSPEAYINALATDTAHKGFMSDFEAMQKADTFVLVLPCGRSAHLELGWAVGAGKNTCIYLNGSHEPELMVKMCDLITNSPGEVLQWMGAI